MFMMEQKQTITDEERLRVKKGNTSEMKAQVKGEWGMSGPKV